MTLAMLRLNFRIWRRSRSVSSGFFMVWCSIISDSCRDMFLGSSCGSVGEANSAKVGEFISCGNLTGVLGVCSSAIRVRIKFILSALNHWGLGFGVWGLGFGVWGL